MLSPLNWTPICGDFLGGPLHPLLYLLRPHILSICCSQRKPSLTGLKPFAGLLVHILIHKNEILSITCKALFRPDTVYLSSLSSPPIHQSFPCYHSDFLLVCAVPFCFRAFANTFFCLLFSTFNSGASPYFQMFILSPSGKLS